MGNSIQAQKRIQVAGSADVSCQSCTFHRQQNCNEMPRTVHGIARCLGRHGLSESEKSPCHSFRRTQQCWGTFFGLFVFFVTTDLDGSCSCYRGTQCRQKQLSGEWTVWKDIIQGSSSGHLEAVSDLTALISLVIKTKFTPSWILTNELISPWFCHIS